MTSPREAATPQRILGQGRILEALAEGAVLTETLDGLSERFSLAPDDVRACLRELVRRGWVAVQAQPSGRLTVRIERRSPRGRPPVTGERRRSAAGTWEL